jgi:hypothetical protein
MLKMQTQQQIDEIRNLKCDICKCGHSRLQHGRIAFCHYGDCAQFRMVWGHGACLIRGCGCNQFTFVRRKDLSEVIKEEEEQKMIRRVMNRAYAEKRRPNLRPKLMEWRKENPTASEDEIWKKYQELRKESGLK